LPILRGAEVVVLHRVRLADGQIIAFEKSHIIYALCPNIWLTTTSARSLYKVWTPNTTCK
jgi:DNA-binding GntR family transcriptional regulator